MDEAVARAKILEAFDVTEEELGAADNGWTEARRQADAETERFIKQLGETAVQLGDGLVARFDTRPV